MSVHGVVIAMAHTRACHAYRHFAGLRRVHLHLLNRNWHASLSEYRGFRIHLLPPVFVWDRSSVARRYAIVV